MSKIADFYKVVEENQELKDELLTLNEKYKDRLDEVNIKEIVEDEIIVIADKYNYTLVKEDFRAEQKEEISEKQLEAIAGGNQLFCLGIGTPSSGYTGFCLIYGHGSDDKRSTNCVFFGCEWFVNIEVF